MLQQQQQQHRFPPIKKPHRFKLLRDVTQQPYRVDNNLNQFLQYLFFLDWNGPILSK